MTLTQLLDSQDRKYARRRFRGPVRTFLAAMFVNIREMRKLEEQILEGRDETVMAFKGSHLNNVGIVAVASALTSQLSSTTLQTPGMADIHWSASGFIIGALLCGVLATMLACASQQLLGLLNDPQSIRMWLSNGRFYYPHHDCHPKYNARGEETTKSPNHHWHRWEKPRLQVSVASVQLLSLPLKFLAAGVVCFLVGFGLYLGFAMRQDLDTAPGRDNNFAILLLFVVVAAVAITIATATNVWKITEVHSAEEMWEKDMQEEEQGSGRDDSDENGVGDYEEGGGRKKRKGMYQRDDNKDEESGSDGDTDERSSLIRRKRRSGGRSRSKDGKEAKKHEEIAKALMHLSLVHKDVAKLLKG